MKKYEFYPVNTFIKKEENIVGEILQVIKDKKIEKFDEPTFAKIENEPFHNGIIEVKVLSKIMVDAPDFARGFLGVSFRINQDNRKFETIYIRPANSRSRDQLRRNHTTQYFSYPDFKFDRLRKESSGVYESYVDIGIEEWIDIKIIVKGIVAELYINNSKNPALIVNDLKHGDSVGAIGLWVEVGTEGYFKDLVITHK